MLETLHLIYKMQMAADGYWNEIQSIKATKETQTTEI